ncbi:MAG: motility protein A [Eubacterium sp.]|nr:motility protein A [Eubacterium sp.]
MDIATLIGMIVGVLMMVFGITFETATMSFNFATITKSFIDIPSIIITIGGSLCGVLASNKLADTISSFKAFSLTLKEPNADAGEVIRNIINLSNIARKEGLLALEEAANGIEDEFLKKGIMLVVDGTDPELVRGIMETDLSCIETRHKTVIGFYQKWGALGPAWGMIGTLIGLIKMLKDLSDPDSIGPNMAVALLTTLYGSIIANWLCEPTSSKLTVNNDLEMVVKEITVEGLLSIQAGENPRVIEEKLKSFLAPTVRDGMNGGEGGE